MQRPKNERVYDINQPHIDPAIATVLNIESNCYCFSATHFFTALPLQAKKKETTPASGVGPRLWCGMTGSTLLQNVYASQWFSMFMLCWYLLSVHCWCREVSNVDESAGKQSKQNIAFPVGISKQRSHKWYIKYVVVHAHVWCDYLLVFCPACLPVCLPACSMSFLVAGVFFQICNFYFALNAMMTVGRKWFPWKQKVWI